MGPTAVPPPSLRRVDLDVRAEVTAGGEPLARIMAAVASLAPDQALVLRVPFEPVPLYGVLGKRGFSHWTEAQRPGDWSIWFFRGAAGPSDRAAAPTAPAPTSATLDVRGLDPPLPLVLVLERLDALSEDDDLIVIHERRPLLLYPQLEERGFTHRTDEPEPGLVRIVVRRRPAPRQ